MGRMNLTRRWIMLAPMVWFIAAALPLLAQSPEAFSADIKVTKRTMTSTGKLYFNGVDKMRVEINVKGRHTIAIANTANGTAYMLLPRQRSYTEIGDPAVKKWSPILRRYNPSAPCKNLSHTNCQRLGMETVNGRLCTEWLLGAGKNVDSAATVWIDQTTGVPIKTASNGTIAELLSVQPGSQDPNLFEIPPGYNKLELGLPMEAFPGP